VRGWVSMHRTNLCNGNIIIHYLCSQVHVWNSLHSFSMNLLFSSRFPPRSGQKNFANFAIFFFPSLRFSPRSLRVTCLPLYDELFIGWKSPPRDGTWEKTLFNPSTAQSGAFFYVSCQPPEHILDNIPGRLDE
jgi:hypothetical protein